MSISAEEQLHGVAILRLIEELGKSLPFLSVRLQRGAGRSAYVLTLTDVSGTQFSGSAAVALYLKSSRKRRTPWRFAFHRTHQEELNRLKAENDRVYIGFICGDDGIAAIDFKTLKLLLDDEIGDQETVAVRRNPGEMYWLTGSDGSLKNAVSRSGFPGEIIEELKITFV